MSIYTVYEPPLKAHESAPNPERFVFVRDGFSFWAFLLTPWWMLRHRLRHRCHRTSGRPAFGRRLDRGHDHRRRALVASHRLRGGDVAPLYPVAPRLEECGHRRRRRSRIGRAAILRCVGPQNLGRAIIVRRRAARIVARSGRGDGAPAVIRGHRLVSTTGSAAVTVAIVDYGSGNLHSAAKAFERAAREEGLAQPIVVTCEPEEVARADRVVLPGVGAFADCRRGLDAVGGMVEALNDSVRARGRPFLGICVGMQLMAERGREYEVTPGLRWIAGEVERITPSDPSLKIPHMGWNTLNACRPHPLFEGIAVGPQGLHAYFVHSFHLKAAARSDLIAEADYGGPLTAVVGRDTMVGTQFHPEKSQRLGLRLIANFLKWKP